MLTVLRRVYIALWVHENELEEILSGYRQIRWEGIVIIYT